MTALSQAAPNLTDHSPDHPIASALETQHQAANHPPIAKGPKEQPLLVASHLSKVFHRGFWRRKTVGVTDVSFRVERGEIFGFLGPNGSGKTTTMKMMMGLLHPTTGEISVMGHPPGALSSRRRVGYLPENPYFYDYLSAEEYLHMVGRLFGLDRQVRSRRVGELIERVGLSMAKKRAMRSYSKGMMQRVGLGQALMGDPDLVVLDEPMSGLDPVGRREVRDLISELRHQGKTVFFSTHILADAEMLCDRVAIVVKGSVRQEGSLSQLLGANLERIDIVFEVPENFDRSVLAAFGLQLRQVGHQFVATPSSHEQADAWALTILQAGGRLISITPHRQTLEDIFLQDAGGPADQVRS